MPRGGYLKGSEAQEEDLCRLLPQLYPSLERARKADLYPLHPQHVILTRDVVLARQPGTWDLVAPMGACHVMTATMPTDSWRRRKGRPGSPEWRRSVKNRMRAIFNTAVNHWAKHLVLGAFGCGAYGNPPELVI